MTAHDATPTPGPWHLETGYAVVHADNGVMMVADCRRGHVDGSWRRPIPEEQREANARLIASAPALAEENARLRDCLQDMTDALAKYIHEQDGSDPEKAPRIMAARAALAPKEPEDE